MSICLPTLVVCLMITNTRTMAGSYQRRFDEVWNRNESCYVFDIWWGYQEWEPTVVQSVDIHRVTQQGCGWLHHFCISDLANRRNWLVKALPDVDFVVSTMTVARWCGHKENGNYTSAPSMTTKVVELTWRPVSSRWPLRCQEEHQSGQTSLQ